MQTFVPYAVWAIIIVICLGIIGMLAFGLRSLVQGRPKANMPITPRQMTMMIAQTA